MPVPLLGNYTGIPVGVNSQGTNTCALYALLVCVEEHVRRKQGGSGARTGFSRATKKSYDHLTDVADGECRDIFGSDLGTLSETGIPFPKCVAAFTLRQERLPLFRFHDPANPGKFMFANIHLMNVKYLNIQDLLQGRQENPFSQEHCHHVLALYQEGQQLGHAMTVVDYHDDAVEVVDYQTESGSSEPFLIDDSHPVWKVWAVYEVAVHGSTGNVAPELAEESRMDPTMVEHSDTLNLEAAQRDYCGVLSTKVAGSMEGLDVGASKKQMTQYTYSNQQLIQNELKANAPRTKAAARAGA